MGIPTPQYVYKAKLKRVVDGDTCVLVISLGCFVHRDTTIRVRGVDTPEVVGATKVAGLAASAFTLAWLSEAEVRAPNPDYPLIVVTELDRSDKYGRLLGVIYRHSDSTTLNDALIASGHAVAYGGGHRG